MNSGDFMIKATFSQNRKALKYKTTQVKWDTEN